MGEELRLRYDVCGNDFTQAGEASSSAKRMLKQLGVDAEIIRRVAICMYEGEINLVIHGGGGVAELMIDGGKIIITLTDKGPGIADIEAAMREGFSTATNEIRELGFGAGMGLPNMKRCSDSLVLKSKPGEGTTVIMEIAL